MLREFKDFLMKGNIVDLAVAFVMGVAFAAVVDSFVNDLVMPIIAMIIGKPDFGDLTFTINDAVLSLSVVPVLAVITYVPACPAFVMKRFAPSSTQESPSSRAVVLVPPASEPAPGSESANAPRTRPLAIGTR